MTGPRPLAGACGVLLVCAVLVPGASRAQAGDSLHLGELQRAAEANDPRSNQRGVWREQTALRLDNLRAERLPTFGVASQAQHQSDVTAVRAPGFLQPFKTTYDANLGTRLKVVDPSRGARAAVERAQLADTEARLAATVFPQRQAVNEAFHTALLLQRQGAIIAATIADLEAQLGLARTRVAEGAALPGDVATLEAEVLRRRQSLDEVGAGRDASLRVLADLTGRAVDSATVLVVPDLARAVQAARATAEPARARPEYQAFAAGRGLTRAREDALTARDRPQLSVFGRSGYGRPGLNFLSREFDTYWLAGIQLEWAPFDWGIARREREAIALQQQVLATEERAFTDRLRRAVIADLSTMDRLERTLATDEAIITLRERVLREARLRRDEGVITVGEYVDRDTDLQAARLAQAQHRAELDQVRSRYLTTLGLEVR